MSGSESKIRTDVNVTVCVEPQCIKLELTYYVWGHSAGHIYERTYIRTYIEKSAC